MTAADTSGTAFHAEFAGRRRKFCLRLGEIEDLERICGAGIGAIMIRLVQHAFYGRDVWETIRLGLEGGGMSEPTATATVIRYRDRPLAEHIGLAARIIEAAVSGVPVEPGNEDAERTDEPATSPPSSGPEPQSASHPTTSDT